MALLSVMVFLGASLLFSMEPMVGRLLFPYFGGAPHLWLTCLMFFQGMLCVGYLYAHLLVQRIGFWHLVVLAIPVMNLPLQFHANPDPHAPLLTILSLLVFHVALPFVALSTTAVVAQAWLFQSSFGLHREPYSLYSASNSGSFLALVGYAFLVEPFLGIRVQSFAWSVAYAIYFIIVFITWLYLRPGKGSNVLNSDIHRIKPKPIHPYVYLQWLLLSGLPSAFLLAVTNYIALDVGSFPFVWVLPLGLYLGSFILTFQDDGGVPGFLKVLWLEVLLAALALYVLGLTHGLILAAHLCTFFAICLVAHGCLYETRPPGYYLTNFYLTIAMGGWIGGAFASLAVPLVFSGLLEYPILLILLGAAFWWHRAGAFTAFWPRASRLAGSIRIIGLAGIIFFIALGMRSDLNQQIQFRHRNFYGTYRILDELGDKNSPPVRKLIHGRTTHGAQLLDPSFRLTPISYYYQGGPISDVYELIPSPRQMAIVGLGSGAISAYARKDDSLTYYEIDPDNEKIAREWFTFLKECKGEIRVIIGDGRLSMQDWGKDNLRYDLITIDAFTGDGIPTHLLTREAIFVYLSRLKKDGLILLHISNRYYDLRPVIKSTAASLGLSGAINILVSKDKLKSYNTTSQCVVLAWNHAQLQPLIDRGWIAFGSRDGLKEVIPWTDDYVNMLSPLTLSPKGNKS